MKLFNKLRTILFDEVTTEIPVITKEESTEKENPKKVKEEPRKRVQENKEDEVIIQKIETPKREKTIEEAYQEEEEVYMPKLKEEAKEEVKKSTFTFPVFGDDEEDIVSSKRRSTKSDKDRERPKERRREAHEEKPRDPVGYTNAFDYSYGKYKGDYKAAREQSRDVLTKTLETKEEHKAFTPSPIISPVYGVLNENYKKDDIVDKKDEKKRVEPLDLDTIRRKAYGTLEDEIEASLGDTFVPETHEEPESLDYEENEDEGISINDLLVDVTDDDTVEQVEETEEEVVEEEPTIGSLDMELFNDIDSEEHAPVEEEEPENEDTEVVEDELGILEQPEVPEVIKEEIDKKDTKKRATKEPKEKEKSKPQENEALGEEDLFDLIESIYERKDEE